MKTFSRFLSVVLLSSALATTSISAMAAQKFEYKFVQLNGTGLKGLPQFEALFNQLGAEGWDFVEINSLGAAIFKRAK